MFHQPPARLHEPLLQARQRPVLDPLRQHEPPPQISQVVGEHAQPQPYLVGPEPMAAQPRHLHRLLAFFDPLLRRSPLVVEPHHRPAVRFQVGDDESHARKQLPEMKLHLGYHTPRCIPTRCLVQETLVPNHRLLASASTGRVKRALSINIGRYFRPRPLRGCARRPPCGRGLGFWRRLFKRCALHRQEGRRRSRIRIRRAAGWR